MSTEAAQFDEMFTVIAGKSGSIDSLLDNFFGFLERRTDFYVQIPPLQGAAKMGFPKGIPEKMLLKAFKKRKFRMLEESVSAPPVAASSSESASLPTPPVPSKKVDSGSPTALSIAPRITAEGKQVPIGNGGIADTYYWTQTLEEITVYIDVDIGVALRGKDVKCDILPSNLSVKVHDTVLMSGPLDEVVKADDSMWTVSTSSNKSSKSASPTSCQIIVTLEKAVKTWWKYVIVGHPEIDTNMVSHSNFYWVECHQMTMLL